MKFIVIYERTKTGYSAYLPDLPGCIAAGPTLDDTRKLMNEAIAMHLEGMREDGEELPQPEAIADYVTLPA